MGLSGLSLDQPPQAQHGPRPVKIEGTRFLSRLEKVMPCVLGEFGRFPIPGMLQLKSGWIDKCDHVTASLRTIHEGL
jgi:hypothetical protein